MDVHTLLAQIDLGSIALPEFQRGYVWNREQVRALMQSLYRGYPVGGLLVWKTETDTSFTRGELSPTRGYVDLLLDGQQRITTLYGIVRGNPPQFFDGNAQTFTGLHFNVETEVFEFYLKQKMQGDPHWVDVTGVMQKGIMPYVQPFMADPEQLGALETYMGRLNQLHKILEIDFHLATVTGHEKTVDVVVDIFNRLNSGGTKLSKGDLALARICATWPDARNEMKTRLAKWQRAGYWFRLDWFLRCITTVLTGKATFDALEKVTTAELRDGMLRAENAVDYILNLLASRLGIDHDRVLGAPNTIPLMARYVDRRGGVITSADERNKMLYWYIHAFLWGRYSMSTESVLGQDLAHIEAVEGGLDRLIGSLRQQRGDLTLRAEDFRGWSTGARFYPLLHMLSRVGGAIDWRSGLPLKSTLLGGANRLHVHHIFPKARLKHYGYSMPLRNTLGNYTFLTAGTNFNVSDKFAHEYLADVETCYPGALQSHWIPMDRDLWRSENYEAFLDARRELLANAANEFLDQLVAGTVADGPPVDIVGWDSTAVGLDEEGRELGETNAWMENQGLPSGERQYAILDEGQDPVVVIDLAWPEGIQVGLSEPVALMLNEEEGDVVAASAAGYRVFTSVDALKRHVESDVLMLQLA